MRKKNKEVDVTLYNALNLIMNECSLHGSCNEDCPMYDSEWKCVRNMPPAYWKALTPKVFENARKELPKDKLISMSCDGCVDQMDCNNRKALDFVGLRVEDLGCSDYRSK